MKITDVEGFVLESPHKYKNPEGFGEAAGVGQIFLLKVSTDEGIAGWSDIETSPRAAGAAISLPESGSGMFEGIKELAVGEDPFCTEMLFDKLYRGTAYYGRRGLAMQLISGLDIACHDIMGKAANVPVYKLLGGGFRDRVRAYASTLFRPKPSDIKKACEFYLKKGFSAIKFGWGVFGQDRTNDVSLVRAAREAVGRDAELMVDAGWKVNRSAFDAVDLLRRIEEYDLYWLEDFLHPEMYSGYAKVKEAGVRTRIAAGEQEAAGWGFRRLINEGKIDVAQPDVTRCGGFTQTRKIIWEAEAAGIDVCPHAWLTGLNTAAALHVNASLPRSLFLEYNVSANPMLTEIIENPPVMDADGYIDVPQGPGLGVTVNEAVLKKYRVNP